MAKEKSWFNSHRDRARRVTVQVGSEHWVGLNIVGFVPEEVGNIQRSSRHTPRRDLGTRMTKEERAVKAKRRIWKFSWVIVGLLIVVLAAVLMAFMTCRRRTQEPFRERQATSEPTSQPDALS